MSNNVPVKLAVLTDEELDLVSGGSSANFFLNQHFQIVKETGSAVQDNTNGAFNAHTHTPQGAI